MKKFTQMTMMLLLVIAIITGCSTANETADQNGKGSQKVQSDFPLKVKDASGKEVTIEERPEKIVSLIPSNTEILFALGLEKEVVGVSDFDNYPEAAAKKTKIGGMEFNVEKIVGLKPDLVLAHESGMATAKDGLKQLEDAGIAVFVVKDATNFDDTYDSIDTISEVTGTESKGDEIIKGMKDDLADIEDKAKSVKEKKKVWVEVSPSPEIYTAGKGTFIDEMLKAINAENAAGDLDGWAKVSEEQPVAYNPDVIVTTYGYYTEKPKEQVIARKAWKDVSAVKNNNIYDVHSDKVTRPGPRLIEGVEELAKAIYPDVFKK
ncbi:iron ABC transporter substrate-binding protein [Fictibacillus phosphorivorans]|uniref:Iron ABC transporter substrate-binding protein n=1 Tax=Fictibacillus phosphorivorans TaxID=1221500 RepID=A0A161RSI0_9BACL|nr:ABC transporter substrate-binding protein [Fictibacillus phosphorivorans]KZE64289.1 iron ABC transporter substrate-binding protein [Fictibacillus phosphorivorans]